MAGDTDKVQAGKEVVKGIGAFVALALYENEFKKFAPTSSAP